MELSLEKKFSLFLSIYINIYFPNENDCVCVHMLKKVSPSRMAHF